MITRPLFDHLTALADSTRSRLLLVLQEHELTVRELQEALQLPQSTVSRHLKVLSDEEWVTSRPEGTSQRYRVLPPPAGSAAEQLWGLVRGEVAASPAARQDAARIREVLARRHGRSRQFFATEAGQWDRLREELFGPRYELQALLGLLDPDAVVGDLGCGTGHLSAAVAPFVRKVIAVDESPPMLAAARARLAAAANVEVREGELELLPVNEMELDLAVLALVLPYVPEPSRVLAEAARALQPGGRLLVVDLQPHDRAEYAQTMGHVWQGFAAGPMLAWLAGAGLIATRYVPLLPEPSARGPGLFLAMARKPD
ncbi:MAG TPA: metalloregulator ArsR/SmtB family transcription factor [Gemmatimonadales bacterium]|nr:metalloregulator ArsR/SmtB family transcription factor [Gemmatimonadales bacterium]